MTQHERVEVRELLIGTLCSYLYNTIVYCLLLLDQYRDLYTIKPSQFNDLTAKKYVLFVGVCGFYPPRMIQRDQAVVVVQSV